MELGEFISRYGRLSEETFLASFEHPFLIEEGKLVLEGAHEDRQVFPIRTSAESITIGRSKRAAVRVKHEQISNRHAVLWPPSVEDSTWYLMDMNSTNGTYVDGVRIEAGDRIPLRSGMVLRFGLEKRLAFLNAREFYRLVCKLQTVKERHEAELKEPESEFDPNASTPSGGTRTYDPTDDHAVSEQAAAVLLCCDPHDPIPLNMNTPVTVGRSPRTATMVLPHHEVSRKHCEVMRRADAIYVRDLGSANGCFNCGRRVGSGWEELLPGKPLNVGPFSLYVEMPGITHSDYGMTAVVQATDITLAGRLEEVSLEDLLQDVESNTKTGTLRLRGSTIDGHVTFRNGQPWTASISTGERGLKALRRLLHLHAGSFRLELDEGIAGEREIPLAFGEVLLDELFSEEDD
ncbi:MAG: FHA domain-containing protein [Planctomycetes bacterium]|nr:FHA domain-containing protein [Planctomycetota bacterium]